MTRIQYVRIQYVMTLRRVLDYSCADDFPPHSEFVAHSMSVALTPRHWRPGWVRQHCRLILRVVGGEK